MKSLGNIGHSMEENDANRDRDHYGYHDGDRAALKYLEQPRSAVHGAHQRGLVAAPQFGQETLRWVKRAHTHSASWTATETRSRCSADWILATHWSTGRGPGCAPHAAAAHSTSDVGWPTLAASSPPRVQPISCPDGLESSCPEVENLGKPMPKGAHSTVDGVDVPTTGADRRGQGDREHDLHTGAI